MVAHVSPRHHLRKRQDDPLAQPSGIAGIENTAITVDSDATAAATGLVFDTAAPTNSPQTAPNLGITTTPVTTLKPSITESPVSEATSATAEASGAIQPISMSTVVGACVGALIGASGLIIMALWFYRRYARALKQQAQSRRALGAARNLQAEEGRRRSRLEPWNKLEDGDDKWEGMYQTKETDNVAPMEKLTMFKKTPSVRTAWTHKSADEPVTFDVQPFVQYHPNLAQELALNEKPDSPVPRQFLGRVDTDPTISWDGDTIGNGSLLSIRTGRMDGAMSPTLHMAIPTPPATSSPLHHWESAEVVHYEDPDSQNPFGIGSERRRSASNPFDIQVTSPPQSERPLSDTTITTEERPRLDKGKGRAVDEDPFADGELPSVQRPFATNHTVSESTSSISSNDRALQSLIAALEVSEEEVKERLRVASMQPSVMSATSYTSMDDEDVTKAFPLPPVNNGGRP